MTGSLLGYYGSGEDGRADGVPSTADGPVGMGACACTYVLSLWLLGSGTITIDFSSNFLKLVLGRIT